MRADRERWLPSDGSLRADPSVSSLRSYTDLSDHAGASPPPLTGVTFNLVNAVVGVGVLAMPFCFREAGLLLGSALLVCIAALTERTLLLLVLSGQIAGAESYSGTALRVFGARAAIGVDVGIILLNFGTAVAYLDVVGDVLFSWSGDCGAKVGLLLLVAIAVVLPLSLIDDLSKLKFVSVAGACVYALFAVVVIALFFSGAGKSSRGEHLWASVGMFRALPIVTLSFACHTVVFPVFVDFLKQSAVAHRMEAERSRRDLSLDAAPTMPDDEVHGGGAGGGAFWDNGGGNNRGGGGGGGGGGGEKRVNSSNTDGSLDTIALTSLHSGESSSSNGGGGGGGDLHANVQAISRFRQGVQATMLFCFFMYAIVGMFGSLTFIEDTLGDVLRNYSLLGGAIARFIEFFFAVSICMTYPMVVFPMRESLSIMIDKSSALTHLFDERACGACGDSATCRSRTLTVGCVVAAYLVAVLVPAIEVVFSINGCLLGLSASFFLPAAMFVRATLMQPNRAAKYSSPRDMKWAYAVLAVSLPLGLVSVVMTFVSLFSDEVQRHENTSSVPECS
jgi:amino acid permease